MGLFINAEEVLAKTLVPAISRMTTGQIDDRLISPAERLLEEAFNLDLDTDGDPYHWRGRFETNPRRRTDFRDDCRKALILIIDRLAINPHGQVRFSGGGSSVTFSGSVPPETASMMDRWGKPRTLYRR